MKELHSAIMAVQKATEAIPKTGYNSYNKYFYATEADVLRIKEIMNENGLIAIPDVVAYDSFPRGDSVQILQHIEYTVIHVETGQSMKVKVLGQGEDKGDKGAYKGFTGANKYFYLKFAGFPTGDDPEREEASKPPQQQNQQGYQRNKQNNQPRQQQPAPPKQQPPPQKQQPAPPPQIPIEAAGPPDEEAIKKGLLDQIAKLAGIPALSKQQTLKVIGMPLGKATVDELQMAKEVMIAFVNRFQNKELTKQDQEILSPPAEQRAS